MGTGTYICKLYSGINKLLPLAGAVQSSPTDIGQAANNSSPAAHRTVKIPCLEAAKTFCILLFITLIPTVLFSPCLREHPPRYGLRHSGAGRDAKAVKNPDSLPPVWGGKRAGEGARGNTGPLKSKGPSPEQDRKNRGKTIDAAREI
jgi:hypothetical protein